MAAYRRVCDSRHLRADCQEPGSAGRKRSLVLPTLGNRVRATFFPVKTSDDRFASGVVCRPMKPATARWCSLLHPADTDSIVGL